MGAQKGNLKCRLPSGLDLSQISNWNTVSRSSSLLNESNEDLPSHTDFPLAYAVEMDAAFRKIQELPGHLGAQLKFNLIFGFLGVPFVSSTYSDSWQAWLTTSETEMQRAVACGSAPGGEWTTILRTWRKNKNKSKTSTT
ncbi:hypothetical protein C8R43DRAFT_945055 [Mycena crocata]|nr:hypothetical protein C8R43DRAFT_945055 [Mycena crocata]